ncbi:MAG: GNAT family N-acetyltransferase [Cohnella sp.]|nr:GNAT family N-acetyltransferase [Cohnella sp.]
MMITYQRLSQLSLNELAQLWNRGFEGYYINVQTSLNSLVTRTADEGISLEDSLAICADGQPIGFVVNGYRSIDGSTIAWNGGTGIVSEYRGQGFGKLLMERNVALYAELGVDTALLEALTQNEKAIRLYENVGYAIADRLVYMQYDGALQDALPQPETSPYTIKTGLPGEIRHLPFYRGLSAWQTQWPSLKNGESLLISYGEEVVGYALFRRAFDEQGLLSAIYLYQCESAPGRPDEANIYSAALSRIFHPLNLPIKRMTVNLRKSNTALVALLSKLGFATAIEQVYMKRKIGG